MTILVLPSPFFPGILLSRKPPETRGNGRFSKRTMVGKNGESTLSTIGIPVVKSPRERSAMECAKETCSATDPRWVLGCMPVHLHICRSHALVDGDVTHLHLHLIPCLCWEWWKSKRLRAPSFAKDSQKTGDSPCRLLQGSARWAQDGAVLASSSGTGLSFNACCKPGQAPCSSGVTVFASVAAAKVAPERTQTKGRGDGAVKGFAQDMISRKSGVAGNSNIGQLSLPVSPCLRRVPGKVDEEVLEKLRRNSWMP